MDEEIYILPVIAIFNNTTQQYEEFLPKIYQQGTGWLNIFPWVYDSNKWHLIGGAGELKMVLQTIDGKYLYTSDGKIILVKKSN